jgi:hypothetical protein
VKEIPLFALIGSQLQMGCEPSAKGVTATMFLHPSAFSRTKLNLVPIFRNDGTMGAL